MLDRGTRLGVYEIQSAIGAGGMGEVYRASDMALGRQVAIKILPEAFATDPERLARFEREAKTLAALNHPNIAQIYGLEKSQGTYAFIMELVEGEDLSQRIARGAIPLDEALPIAKQICEALEAAHEQGIIHRDLKPANIKITPNGVVKVLDFGLAKLTETSGSSTHDLSLSPTITSPAMMTGVGVLLGTAAYMAPEQAKGRAADKRSDIWAFGCVLYEMLTAKRAFGGDDVSDTVANVLKVEPSWEALPSGLSPTLVVYLKRCLSKDAKQRVHDIADVRLALEGAFETTAPQTTSSSTLPEARGRPAWMAATAVVAAVIVTLAVPAVRHLRETPPIPSPETRADISTPPASNPTSFALSPDGRLLVFAAAADGTSRLWLRPLRATSAEPLPETDGAIFPFWSPDSRSVAFFADRKLKRIDIDGGRPLSLADAASGRGGTWNADGVIVFAPTNIGPLFRVPASGGAPAAVTKLDRQVSHRFPFFLPDGRQFLFSAGATPETAGTDTGGVYLGSLDSAETHRLMPADTVRVAYLPPGWLLWVRGGTLVARRLDLERKALTDDPITLADPVTVDPFYAFDGSNEAGAGALSVSATGVVAYRARGAAAKRQLAWFDRSGKTLGVLGAADESNLVGPGLSPDGRRVAVQRTVQGNVDIWILDGARTSRFTFDAGSDEMPLWSPDGSRIVFDSDRKGKSNFNGLYVKAANGAGSEELLFESAQYKSANSWSPDGRFLLYQTQRDPNNNASDLWVLPLTGDQKPFVFLGSPFDERNGQFSPDGRWVAYQSTESGRPEIYVRPFPGPGGQWQVSTSGGVQPRWRRDGRELYYIAPEGALMASPVSVNGAAFQPGVPMALFQPRIWGGGTNATIRKQYDVTADGRFLINVTAADESTTPITLMINWNREGGR
jgi:serine/threonine protein kinase